MLWSLSAQTEDTASRRWARHDVTDIKEKERINFVVEGIQAVSHVEEDPRFGGQGRQVGDKLLKPRYTRKAKAWKSFPTTSPSWLPTYIYNEGWIKNGLTAALVDSSQGPLSHVCTVQYGVIKQRSQSSSSPTPVSSWLSIFCSPSLRMAGSKKLRLLMSRKHLEHDCNDYELCFFGGGGGVYWIKNN